MADQVFVQFKFTETTKHGSYSDAIYYPLDVYNSLSAEQIQADKLARINSFVAVVDNPPVVEEVIVAEPSKADLIAQKEELLAKVEELTLAIGKK